MIEMIELALLIIMISSVPVFLIMFIKFYINYKNYQVKITIYSLIVLLCFGLAVAYDFARLFSFMFHLPAEGFPGKIGFCVKIFLFLMGLYYENRLLVLYLHNAEIPVKYDDFQKNFHIGLIVIYSIIATITIHKGPTDPFGYFNYTVEPFSFLILFFICLVIAGHLMIKGGTWIRKIKNRGTKGKVIFILAFFSYMSLERFFSFSPIITSYYSPFTQLITFSSDLTVGVLVIIMLLVYPQIVEEMGSLFSVQSVLLFNKNGELLLNFHLTTRIQSRKNLLLGGFIQALTQSSEEEKIFNSNINVIDFGDLKLIIKLGNRVYGVLLVKNNSRLLEERLEVLINQFEGLHEKEFLDWNAALNSINIDKTIEYIFELFN